jgi:glycosyltransferase involved in cell wall biosynthesis/SAM-dependent methyltransferase
MDDAHRRYPTEEHQRFAPDTRRGAVVVANILESWVDFRTVLDLGCGTGIWLNVLRDGGRRQVFGVDFEATGPADLAVDPELILTADLGQKLDLHRRYDLVVCLEVAEHIDAQFADVVVENCTRHADLILFSAALPGQQGVHHVNEQPPQYWAERFQRRGYTVFDLIRPLIWNEPQIPLWYRQNILLFARDGSSQLDPLRAAAVATPGLPLAVAHPDYMQWFSRHAQSATADADSARQRLIEAQTEFESSLARQRDSEAQARSAFDAAWADATREWHAASDARVAAEAALAKSECRLDEAVRAHSAADAALAQTRQELVTERTARDTARRAHNLVSAELATARGEIARLWLERQVILKSMSWRLTEPLRTLGRHLPYRLRIILRKAFGVRGAADATMRIPQQAVAVPAPPASSPASTALAIPPEALPLGTAARRIVFVSGEPDIPGHVYRVQRYVDAARALGNDVDWLPLHDVVARGEALAQASVVIIWRAPNGPEVAHALWIARSNGAKVLFDLDDLMFDPKLASIEIIDGIRTQDLTAADAAAHFQRIREVVVQVDACTCTTEELARHLRALDRITFVLPNLFDAATLRTSRLAVRQRSQSGDGIVRIGYATGTRTHQRDFFNAALALERVLVERPQCRLVLFHDPDSGRPLLDVAEFSNLARLTEQIEWRDRVSLAGLPHELARFDINLAPLEVGNPFCEAKSELKFVEASLVEVCTIASPTGPLRRAIRDRETGRLANTPEEWADALRELIDDPALRGRMAHAAYLDVLARFGPETGTTSLRSLLEQLSGNEAAARAFQLDLHRRQMPAARGVALPDSEVVFASDTLGEAEVTVAIPLYNYVGYVIEALESVHAQSLQSLDLVVVDDASTDGSLAAAVDWSQRHAGRFNRVVVLRNRRNAGLGLSRNAGFDAAETPFVLPLDADNRLRPACCAVCLEVIRASGAAFAYPSLQRFGDSTAVMGLEPFQPMRFVSGNYIDAMAMIAKSAWAAVGGYDDIRPNGWDDYELWCSFVERGLWGVQVPQILAEYRVHARSMLRTMTDERTNKLRVIGELERRHPWLMIRHDE